MTTRCCDDCYNSHRDCIAHGSCLCHAGPVAHLSFGDAARCATVLDALRSGARYQPPHSAWTFEGGQVTMLYPEGAETVRSVEGVERIGECLIAVTLGAVEAVQ